MLLIRLSSSNRLSLFSIYVAPPPTGLRAQFFLRFRRSLTVSYIAISIFLLLLSHCISVPLWFHGTTLFPLSLSFLTRVTHIFLQPRRSPAPSIFYLYQSFDASTYVYPSLALPLRISSIFIRSLMLLCLSFSRSPAPNISHLRFLFVLYICLSLSHFLQ